MPSRREDASKSWYKLGTRLLVTTQKYSKFAYELTKLALSKSQSLGPFDLREGVAIYESTVERGSRVQGVGCRVQGVRCRA